MSGPLAAILNHPTILRVRRNHALEHATIHILTRRHRETSVYARSGPTGLAIYGDLPTEAIADALGEALRRLRNGDYQLAVHPNCGTNLVTTAGLTGLFSVIALKVQGRKRGFWHFLGSLPLVILAAMAAQIAAEPLGQLLQLYVTTEGEVGDLKIESITRRNQGRFVLHTVKTVD